MVGSTKLFRNQLKLNELVCFICSLSSVLNFTFTHCHGLVCHIDVFVASVVYVIFSFRLSLSSRFVQYLYAQRSVNSPYFCWSFGHTKWLIGSAKRSSDTDQITSDVSEAWVLVWTKLGEFRCGWSSVWTKFEVGKFRCSARRRLAVGTMENETVFLETQTLYVRYTHFCTVYCV